MRARSASRHTWRSGASSPSPCLQAETLRYVLGQLTLSFLPHSNLACVLQAQLGFIRVLLLPMLQAWEDAHGKMGWALDVDAPHNTTSSSSARPTQTATPQPRSATVMPAPSMRLPQHVAPQTHNNTMLRVATAVAMVAQGRHDMGAKKPTFAPTQLQAAVAAARTSQGHNGTGTARAHHPSLCGRFWSALSSVLRYC